MWSTGALKLMTRMDGARIDRKDLKRVRDGRQMHLLLATSSPANFDLIQIMKVCL